MMEPENNSVPNSPPYINEAKQFIQFVSQNPESLENGDVSFLREYLLSLGVDLSHHSSPNNKTEPSDQQLQKIKIESLESLQHKLRTLQADFLNNPGVQVEEIKNKQEIQDIQRLCVRAEQTFQQKLLELGVINPSTLEQEETPVSLSYQLFKKELTTTKRNCQILAICNELVNQRNSSESLQIPMSSSAPSDTMIFDMPLEPTPPNSRKKKKSANNKIPNQTSLSTTSPTPTSLSSSFSNFGMGVIQSTGSLLGWGNTTTVPPPSPSNDLALSMELHEERVEAQRQLEEELLKLQPKIQEAESQYSGSLRSSRESPAPSRRSQGSVRDEAPTTSPLLSKKNSYGIYDPHM